MKIESRKAESQESASNRAMKEKIISKNNTGHPEIKEFTKKAIRKELCAPGLSSRKSGARYSPGNSSSSLPAKKLLIIFIAFAFLVSPIYAGDFYIDATSGTIFFINATLARVGIGTVNPSGALEINSTTVPALKINGTAEFGDALDMGSNKITSLGTPTADADAATKSYVDASGGSEFNLTQNGTIITSGSGNFTVPPNVYSITVTVIGGGGGGGAAQGEDGTIGYSGSDGGATNFGEIRVSGGGNGTKGTQPNDPGSGGSGGTDTIKSTFNGTISTNFIIINGSSGGGGSDRGEGNNGADSIFYSGGTGGSGSGNGDGGGGGGGGASFYAPGGSGGFGDDASSAGPGSNGSFGSGGGGAGGNVYSGGGGGGGSGAVIISPNLNVYPGQTISYSVGSGGAGGDSNKANHGGDGGSGAIIIGW